jgi:hypothetical protein
MILADEPGYIKAGIPLSETNPAGHFLRLRISFE